MHTHFKSVVFVYGIFKQKIFSIRLQCANETTKQQWYASFLTCNAGKCNVESLNIPCQIFLRNILTFVFMPYVLHMSDLRTIFWPCQMYDPEKKCGRCIYLEALNLINTFHFIWVSLWFYGSIFSFVW